MITKKLVLAGVVAAALLGGGAAVLDQIAPAGRTPPSAGTGHSSADSGIPHPSGAGAGGTAGAGDGTESTSAATSPSEGAPSEAAASDPTGRRVLEVLPPASAAPTGLPVPSPPAALIRTPLPAPASAQGKLVEGFPVHVVTFPQRTVLVSTSVSSGDRTLQVTADGISELSAAQITGHFQQSLLALGFQSEAVTSGDGQHSVRLSRGTDTVTVAITTTGTGSTRFTLLGTLHA
jgi:hypothetical protein